MALCAAGWLWIDLGTTLWRRGVMPGGTGQLQVARDLYSVWLKQPQIKDLRVVSHKFVVTMAAKGIEMMLRDRLCVCVCVCALKDPKP